MNHPNIFETAGLLSWPLLGLGAMAITIFLERVIYVQKTQIKASEFLDGIINLLKSSRLLEALTLCEETRGPVAAIIRSALLQHKSQNQEIRDVIHTVAILEIPSLEKRQGLLGVIAGLSPLLGLLGTVLACLEALQRLGQQERAANSVDFASDLSTAFVTTVIGLVIAIVAYCAREFLRSRTDSIVRDMEWAANEIFRVLTVEATFEWGKLPKSSLEEKSGENELEEI